MGEKAHCGFRRNGRAVRLESSHRSAGIYAGSAVEYLGVSCSGQYWRRRVVPRNVR